jgi:hypothetical protein
MTQEIESVRIIPDSVPAKGRARLLDPACCDGPDCANLPTHKIPGFFGVGKFCDKCAGFLGALIVNASEHEIPTPEGQAALKKIGWK